MCITDVGIGETAVITSVDATEFAVQRLMIMGLVEGAIVKHVSSTGATHEFKIFDNTIAFSEEQAQHFTVEPV